MGGYPDDALLDHALGLARGERVLYVPTASAENPAGTVLWYERLRGRASLTPLTFFPWPPADLRELVLAQDLVLVAGGNTANALAGWSAGMICWFEQGVTDSFGPQLAAMDCLGFLPGSACPHFDGEERRRPVYTEL